ncbi:transient receptor potential channel pyrexia-like isoform X4 [Xenia sp. Carnegie-2017]|uniref:transient receptor potential channel pyrexia-like isoform X4 n=1 Tax=Xenia sp. Carnegie-2017 TaxID=2897299 RepID=UPI001F040189|nr:transient receptor potential channel pyrexia-like isoform X4 [Xenia sp. Carnegie-2017]
MNNMENGKEPGSRLSQLSGYNSRRSCVGEVHKPYEKMLLEELPGADINKQDKFGRSPLHVAAAVDYDRMVEFLIKNGANINIITHGEGQMPIHFAAKNDACKSIKMLLGYGANIDSRDKKNRTPLQVAAEMNRAKSSKLLVQRGAPACVHDNKGLSALSFLIEKLPDVAIVALNQFYSTCIINRKEFFFLNYLEGNVLEDPKSPAFSPLEIAVHNQEFDVILHPVMKRLVDVKWQQFGRHEAICNFVINILYAVLWTILAVTSPADANALYLPWLKNSWRIALSMIVCLMTLDEIRRQVTGTVRYRNRQRKWISWRISEINDDLKHCHPRWPQEESYLKSEIKTIRQRPLISSSDSWMYFDWFSLILILAAIVSHLVFFNINSDLSQIIYARIITVLLLVLWLRIMQYARPFEKAGIFVAIFSHISKDILNWAILTVVITIPYACAFWITFGELSPRPVRSYSDVSSLIFELFQMIIVGDFDFQALLETDAVMARILCGSYIAIMAIINLNILIALLSDTFTRVYGNAVANALMQRAKTILYLEKSLSEKRKKSYHDFILNFGSPETLDFRRDVLGSNDRDEQKASDMLMESVSEIHELIHDRFATKYGEGKRSDLDHIKESIAKIHEEFHTAKIYGDHRKLEQKVNTIEKILIRLSAALKIDISESNFEKWSSFNSNHGDEDNILLKEDREIDCHRPSTHFDKKGSDSNAKYNKGAFEIRPGQLYFPVTDMNQLSDEFQSTLGRKSIGSNKHSSNIRNDLYQFSDYDDDQPEDVCPTHPTSDNNGNNMMRTTYKSFTDLNKKRKSLQGNDSRKRLSKIRAHEKNATYDQGMRSRTPLHARYGSMNDIRYNLNSSIPSPAQQVWPYCRRSSEASYVYKPYDRRNSPRDPFYEESGQMLNDQTNQTNHERQSVRSLFGGSLSNNQWKESEEISLLNEITPSYHSSMRLVASESEMSLSQESTTNDKTIVAHER